LHLNSKHLQTTINDYKSVFTGYQTEVCSFLLKKSKVMNTLRNSVRLIGRVGVEPEIKVFESGKRKAKLVLATNEVYVNTQTGERITETHWHNLVLWGSLVSLAEQYIHKGKELAKKGKLFNRSYEDKTGQKRYITEILVSDIVLLGSKQRAE
jgi:single-strand DNA-binding protein